MLISYPKNDRSEVQSVVIPYEHEENTAEGSEFLDDAIRTKEQPFGETTVKEDQ